MLIARFFINTHPFTSRVLFLHIRRSTSETRHTFPNMSQKITGKNLQYDQSLPPFLARLKGQRVANADGPDPILASHRRAAKPRSASEEAEDGPLIVDDEGRNVVAGLTVGVDGTVTGEREEGDGGDGDVEGQQADGEHTGKIDKEKEQVAAIGASKKRKVGKIVGVDAEDDEPERHEPAKRKDAGAGKGGSQPPEKTSASNSKGPIKGKRKAKKIKLSFGDEAD